MGENLPALDDAGLLERYLAEGDEAAITVLYLRYQSNLFAYGVRVLGNADDARDLVQDTWEAVITYRGLTPSGHFRGLLFGVAQRLTLRAFQRRDRWNAARSEFEWAGGALQSGACAFCDRPAYRGDLCGAHARRRAKGATDEEMRKPIREWKRRA